RHESWDSDAEVLARTLKPLLRKRDAWAGAARERANTVPTATGRTFAARGVDVVDIAEGVAVFLRSQGLESQILPGENATVVQARGRPGWRRLAGMSPILEVRLSRSDDRLFVEVAPGRWGERAAIGVASLVAWPLAALPAYGAFVAAKLPDQTYRF